MAAYLVDGLVASVDGCTPALPVAGATVPLDWRVRVADEAGGTVDPSGVEWTGDVSEDGVRWARFGRAGRWRWVRLERVLDLVADPRERVAHLRPAPLPVEDSYVLRRALPYLVVLARRVALHAACVAFGDAAVLLCGDAGAGKSSLALALDAAGHPVLADDHVALSSEADDGVFHAHVSWPAADAAPDARRELRPDLPLARSKSSAPLLTDRPHTARVRRIAFLRRGRRLDVGRLSPGDVATRLLRDVFFVADPLDPTETARHLEAAGRLAETAVGVELQVPDGWVRLREGLDAVAAALRQGL